MNATLEVGRAAPSIRTLLVLGRVSNLPTVWSNCLAGWQISGGGPTYKLVLLCVGATLLYVGGMFLNDAFDVDFDRQHRPERPVPSGAISLQAVWRWGFWWMLAGVTCIALLGQAPLVVALLLALFIILYDAIHKMFVLAPFIMALCRFLLVLLASAAAQMDITGLSVWTALVLAAYILGLSFLARKEAMPGPLQYWPCILLAAPIVLALVVNPGSNLGRGMVLCVVYGLWVVRSLRFTYWAAQVNIGRSVSSLLAGIVLVDLLSTGGMTGPQVVIFTALFCMALLFQRFVPAT